MGSKLPRLRRTVARMGDLGCTWKEDRLGAPSKLRWIALATLLALFAGGCSEPPSPSSAPSGESFPVTIGAVTLPRRPERIVSLSPTATEILFAIGAGRQVVAVDEASSYPADAPRTELSGYTPNLEAIASYRPDLVVYSSDPGELAGALETLGTPGILQPPAGGLDDAYRQIEQLGAATGRRREAAKLVDSMKRRIAAIGRAAPEGVTPRTYYHELDEGYYTATSKTFIGEVYGLLGLDNIADAAGTGYVQLSGEFIVRANPDLIFLADARCCGQSAATVAARPGWDQIDAVKNGAVFPLDDDVASRWGPRTVEFVEAVAAGLNREGGRR